MCMGSGGAPGKCRRKLAGNMVEELESKEVVKPSSNGAESGAPPFTAARVAQGLL